MTVVFPAFGPHGSTFVPMTQAADLRQLPPRAPTRAAAPNAAPACPSLARNEFACRDNIPGTTSDGDTMTLVEDDRMAQTLAANRADDPLDISGLPWAATIRHCHSQSGGARIAGGTQDRTRVRRGARIAHESPKFYDALRECAFGYYK